MMLSNLPSKSSTNGKRAFIVTQSIKKLDAEDREWALNKKGFKRVSDDKPADLDDLSEENYSSLFYKDILYIPKEIDQRLIITYSPRYAAYQKEVRSRQVERAKKMVESGSCKKQHKNPNDPGRFIGKLAVTKDGEKAGIEYYFDEKKLAEEELYDGLYTVCTDLLEDDVKDILKVSEGRWQIEACFRTLKTEFEARPVYVRNEDRIEAHFLSCFLSLLIYRLMERKLGNSYTCDELLETLKGMNFADLNGQGFMPLYRRTKLTDDLHSVCGFRTDYEFITKMKMREIQKLSKRAK